MRRFLRYAAIACGVVVLLLGVAFGVLQTGWGKDRIAAIVSASVSEPGAMELTIGRLRGFVPWSFEVSDISIRDADGPFLEIAQLTFDLDVPAALSGRYLVRDAVAGGVRVLRLPADDAAAPPAEDGPLIPLWPEAFALEDFLVTDLWIAPEIAGRATTLRASGRIAPDSGAGVDVILDVASTDGGGLNAVVFLRHDPDADVVSLATEITEPPGGLIARLLGLPGDSPVMAQIVGEGPLEAWDGEVFAAFGSAEWSGTFGIRSGSNTRVELAGHANVLPFVDPALGPLIGPQLEIRAVAEITGQETIEIAEATLVGATASLSARGALGIADSQADLAFELQIPDLAPYATLAGEATRGALDASGTLRGALRAPAFETRIDLRGLALRGYSADALALALVGAVHPKSDGTLLGKVRGTGRVTGLAGAPAALGSLLGPEISLTFAATGAEDTATEIDSLTISAANLTAEATGTIDLEAGTTDARLTFAIPDAAPLAAGAGIDAAGRIDGSARTALALASQTGTLDLALTVHDLVLPEPTTRALTGRTVALEAALSLGDGDLLRVERLDLRGERARLAYQGDVAADFSGLDGRLEAEIADLAPLSEMVGAPLTGALRADAVVGGAFEALAVDATLVGRAVGLDDLRIDRIETRVTANDATGAPSGAIAAEIEAHGAPPVEMRASYRLEDGGALALSGLTASTPGGTSLAADLRVDLARGLIAGEAAVGIEALAELAAFADLDATGAATADLTFSHAGGRQNARFVLGAQKLALGGATPLSVATVDATGDLSDVLGTTPRLSATIDAARLEGDGMRVETWRAAIAGDAAKATFESVVEGDLGVPATISLAGDVARDGETIAVRLARLEGDVAQIPIALTDALRARLGPGQAMSADGVLDVGGGAVTIAASVTETETDATVTIAALPLALLERWLPGLGRDGRLDASLRIQGPPDATRGTLAAEATDLTVDIGTEDVAAPPVSIAVSGAWGNGTAAAEAGLEGLPGTSATASATLPFALSLVPFAASISAQDPLDATVRAEGDLARLSALLPLGEDRLAGAIDAEVTASGSLGAPSLVGRASLSDGRYESFDADAVIDALSLALVFDGQEIRIERLEATDGDAGRLEGGGTIALGADEETRLTVRLDRFFMLRRDEITAPFTGEITAGRDAAGIALRGALVSQPVEVRIPERLPASTIELEVTEVNGTGAEPAPASQASAGEPAAPIALDLSVEFPQQLFVRGRGLESEWRGALHIGGTADAPRIEGGLDLVRGRFEFIDKIFDLRSGSVRLDGSDPPDPELSLVAEADAGDILARVSISGPVSAIEIAFESEPALPKDEILAQILFGKSASEISPFQAAQLARTVATLSGSGGPDILGQVREVLGVDDISVTTDGTGTSGAALGVGKYVADGVYLRAQQGITEDSTKAGVEVEITDSITVESDVGANAEASTWLNWQFRY